MTSIRRKSFYVLKWILKIFTFEKENGMDCKIHAIHLDGKSLKMRNSLRIYTKKLFIVSQKLKYQNK